jgi:hypothetical protein
VFNLLREEHRLTVFENRVLRRIFGPKRDGVTGEWRRLHNEEFYDYVGPTTLPPSCTDCLKSLGVPTSWSPKGIVQACPGIALPSWSVLLAQYYLSDQIKKNEMGDACGTYCRQERYTQAFGGEA